MARTLSQLAATPVTVLKGIGPERARALERLEVTNVLDLLTYYPRRYVDRSREARIGDLTVGEEATVLVEVKATNARRTRGGKVLVTCDVTDGSAHMRLTFFNQSWRERQLRPGMQVLVFGKLDVFQGRKQMTNPVVDLVGDRTGKLIPVYPQSDKARVYTWDIARWLDEVLERAGEFAEPAPSALLDRFDFVDRTAAFRGIHHPETMHEADEARRRLVFDELFRLQLALVLRKRALERRSAGIVHEVGGDLVRRFHEGLPYDLTRAQVRVIDEIERDLVRNHPMHRLLQGDVGSGKTVVALSALLVAVEGGHQGAFMAPTEVLAEQHALSVRALLEGFTLPADNLLGDRALKVELLTGRTTATERRRILGGLESGEADILIGTHALIEEGVAFRSLGVVVVDEQHRFGVEQRAALREKGAGELVPDVLVMTATPIPRTAAMTVYGDLDVSVLDEKPPGRERIATSWEKVSPGELTLGELAVWAKVRDEVAAGRQAYVVCPLIEESEKLEVRSAEETYEELSRDELVDMRLALLHGRMTSGEKEKTMTLFRSGVIDVLVSTTVIEVGVDVPNATVMVILDADRFGIAQLHQLRGRVGRGPGLASWCVLVGAGATPEAEERLNALVRSQDGFELAEVDLDIRGEGTIMGERQKGRNDLKLASLRRDRELVAHARQAAIELVDEDPGLSAHAQLLAEVEVFLDDEDREYLLKG
ncbi:MAG TPA: ATP-dependent DNA helicase RecG [Acidimicrobiales bacterium]|jgi:ATP-dependent DNA helicase RecG|nr:ATP-dependent DNA helicase RecG [Acidimicrobiales bacterium]